MKTTTRNKKKSLYSGNSQGLQQGIDTGVATGSGIVSAINPIVGGLIQMGHASGNMSTKFIDQATVRDDGTQNSIAAGFAGMLNPFSSMGSMIEGFKQGDVLQAMNMGFGAKAQHDLNKEILESRNEEPSSIIDTSSNTSLGGKIRGVGSENTKITDDVTINTGRDSDNTSYATEGVQFASGLIKARNAGAFDGAADGAESIGNAASEVPIDDIDADFQDINVDSEISDIYPEFDTPKAAVPKDMSNLTGDPYFDQEIKPFELPDASKGVDESLSKINLDMSNLNGDPYFDASPNSNLIGKEKEYEGIIDMVDPKYKPSDKTSKNENNQLNNNLYDFNRGKKALKYDYLNNY